MIGNRNTVQTTIGVFLLAVLLAAGCGPTLYSVTPPPPTRVAQLTSKSPLFSKRKHFVKLSVGVALAVNCYGGRPCSKMRTSIADPNIVKIVPAHLARLERDHLTLDNMPASTLILVGLSPGNTLVRLYTKQGSTTIRVTVLD